MNQHYSPPSLKGEDCIGIEEFAVRKGHVYKTIVVDLKTERIRYVGEGKGADALDKFWKHIRKERSHKACCHKSLTAFISSVYEGAEMQYMYLTISML